MLVVPGGWGWMGVIVVGAITFHWHHNPIKRNIDSKSTFTGALGSTSS